MITYVRVGWNYLLHGDQLKKMKLSLVMNVKEEIRKFHRNVRSVKRTKSGTKVTPFVIVAT